MQGPEGLMGNMKKALLALLAILLLGGGGAGAYFYFQKPAQAAVGETQEHQAAKEADKEEEGDGHGGGGGTDFVELDPLILPVIDDSGVTQVVSIVVVLEAASARAAEDIKKFSPRLKDAYIQEMYGMLNKRAALQGGVIQVGMIKEKLSAISHRVMGEDKINDVLLQVVQQRPL